MFILAARLRSISAYPILSGCISSTVCQKVYVAILDLFFNARQAEWMHFMFLLLLFLNFKTSPHPLVT